LVYVKVLLKKRFYVEPYGITVRSSNSQPNKDAIDCTAIYQLDPVEIGKSLEIRRRDIVELDDESVVSFTEDCSKYLSARGYNGIPVTNEERDFPLAYSLVVHKNMPMVERIIRAIYAPHNIYCIHYDQKSSKSFIAGVENLAKCFPNIFIASKLESVQYAHITRLRADLNCLSDLMRSEVKWKYAINLCGQDFPLKSNYELVQELKMLKGANMLESSRPSELKRQRFSFQHELKDVPYEYQKLPVRTTAAKSPPPHDIEMFIGSAYFVLSRDFVQYVQTSQLAKDFFEWSADTYSPDEHFWATLARVPGVPGEILRMMYPVDQLTTVASGLLEESAKDYMSKSCSRKPGMHEYLSIPGSEEIEIGLCNVGFVPLYGTNIEEKILAVFSPQSLNVLVGLYLLNKWWSPEDILKTADSSRTGLVEVRTLGERVVLYVLNRIVYRMKEKAEDDVAFICHGEDEIAKILWENGEAIGFYSVKPEGKVCDGFLTTCYQLPVMDTIFIRKCHRGNGHGFQMLKDFVASFKPGSIGLKYPLSPAMKKVCEKYLSSYPEDSKLLLEIQGVGIPSQRTPIAKKLHEIDRKGNHQIVRKLNFDREDNDTQVEVRITEELEIVEYQKVGNEVMQIKIKEVKDTIITSRQNIKPVVQDAEDDKLPLNLQELELK
ncbi:beta-1,3-galactosyl-O-glycosyl-glycoprotein beta-1,6-N-acetylglucosaminyltransferase 4, partial [Clarias magur]